MMNKILIVEDEFSISNFMKTVLEGDGYTVEVATCAAQACAALEKMEFSAMLLDLGLPDADGLELLRELGSAMACRSSWSPPAPRKAKKSRRWIAARMTTSPNRLVRRSCWRASGQRCAGPGPPPIFPPLPPAS